MNKYAKRKQFSLFDSTITATFLYLFYKKNINYTEPAIQKCKTSQRPKVVALHLLCLTYEFSSLVLCFFAYSMIFALLTFVIVIVITPKEDSDNVSFILLSQ